MKEQQMLNSWVKTWMKAGKELQKIKNEEIRSADERKAIKSLNSAFKSAVRNNPPKPYSGLIELQKYLSLLKQ